MVVLLEKELQEEVTPIYFNISDEIEKGMQKHFFPAEKKRYIHINRFAVVDNRNYSKNHPTCVVREENGKEHQFHAIVLKGPAALKYDETREGGSSVFLVTYGAIEGYVDPLGDPAMNVPHGC
jgi:hypothetical protein